MTASPNQIIPCAETLLKPRAHADIEYNSHTTMTTHHPTGCDADDGMDDDFMDMGGMGSDSDDE